MRCQSEGTLEVWGSSVAKVQEWIDKNSTRLEIAKLVTNVLTNFKSGQNIVLHDDILFDGVGKVFAAQHRMGWRLFLDGCLAGDWSRYE